MNSLNKDRIAHADRVIWMMIKPKRRRRKRRTAQLAWCKINKMMAVLFTRIYILSLESGRWEREPSKKKRINIDKEHKRGKEICIDES